MFPRFSIIVATLNRKEMLLDALDSVYSQDADVEIIIADGGSTDGTLSAISGLPNIALEKGPDRGLYDAFNKGLAKARGDIVGILNSDDIYEPGAFAAVEEAFSRNPTADAVCGTATLVEGRRLIEVYEDDASKRLTSRAALIGSCVLNARFFRRNALAGIGPFDLQYRFVADRDFLARCCEAGLTTAPFRERVYCYRKHPGSLTFSSDVDKGLAVHAELWRLAQNWQQAERASPEFKHMALLLKGRCVAKLAQAELGRGRLATGLRHLLIEDGKLSFDPAKALAVSGADWLSQCLLRSAP
jgi:glycosyltransferase involved in cell wall biosynthesis